MKAIVFEEFGGKLKEKDFPTPKISDNEVLIEIECAAVNPVDWKIREGLLKNRLPHEFPIIPGWDAAGKIKEIGKAVKKFKVGDEVYAYCRKPTIHSGTYAEYINVDADHVALKPKKLTFAQASAIPLVGLTSWQALFDVANLQAGETILIHAGAGGVGGMAIQFAKNVGAKVIATASQKNHDYVKKLGADEIIDYSKEDFVQKIKQKHPQGLDVVLDTVGGETLRKSFEVTKDGGRIVSIVENLQHPPKDNVKFGYVFVRPNGLQLHQIADLINAGKVIAPKVEEMPLKNAEEAFNKSKTGHTQGKIVLKIR